MSVLASEIVTKVSTLLFDVNNVKWSQTELLMWITDAQRAIAALVPEATSDVVSVQMTAGPRQTIPSGGWMLLEVTRNMGTTGTTSGRVMKRIDRAVLDETNPEWQAASEVAAPQVYMYNLRDKVAFYVSPPSDGTGFLEVNYSVMPTVITDPTSPLTVMDLYAPAVCDYVMWRALSKKVPFAGDPQAAQPYFESFAMYVGKDGQSAGTIAGEMGALAVTPPQEQGSQQGQR